MTTDDALYAAVLADPEADAPRLAYADHLTDTAGRVECEKCEGKGHNHTNLSSTFYGQCPACHGDRVVSDGREERAEFIRVQCGLARLEADVAAMGPCHCSGPDPTGCSRCREGKRRGLFVGISEYRQREQELFNRHADRWFEDVICTNNAEMSYSPATGVWHLIRRGFVDEARAPLATLIGGRCEQCALPDYPPRLVGNRVGGCSACSGTGRTEGVGVDLVRRHPLTRVVVTDREPYSVRETRRHSWYDRGRTEPGDAHPESDLPAEVFRLLADGEQDYGRTDAWFYLTRDAASAALGAAVLSLLRSRAADTRLSLPRGSEVY